MIVDLNYSLLESIYRLNEGFASWVEYLGYNKTHPEWRDVSSFDLIFKKILLVLKLNALVGQFFCSKIISFSKR